MMNYDLHIVKSLHSASQSTKIEVIPTNDEKFIALNFGVFIGTRKRKHDEVAVYEYLCFIDNFKFMPCSLDKLVESLPDTVFSPRPLLSGLYRRAAKTVEEKRKLSILICGFIQ